MNIKNLISPTKLPQVATVIVCLVLYAAASLKFEGFATGQTFVNLLTDNAFLGIAAIGSTFVILAGGIDLSVGSMIGYTSITMAVLVQHKGWNPVAAAAVLLAGGALLGALTGLVIHIFKLPSFLITLATMFLVRGLGYVTSMESISLTHPLYVKASEFATPLGPNISIGLVPMIYIAVLIVAMFIAKYTPFGRNAYAVGGNPDAARLMGVPVGPTNVGVYAVSGFCSALAGLVFTIYSASGNASAAMGLELDAIAAVVIGGTLLTGGIGGIFGTFVGVLIFGIIQTAIAFQGTLNSWWTKIAIAGLLLAFILLQRILDRIRP